MDNIDIVKEMYKRFAAGNTEAIKVIFDEDIRWNQMKGFPGGGRHLGAEAVFKYVFKPFKEQWQDWRAIVERYIDSGDGAFVIGYYEGTYSETGKHMKSNFACEYKIKDGKIIEFNQYTDTFLIAQAMGLTNE